MFLVKREGAQVYNNSRGAEEEGIDWEMFDNMASNNSMTTSSVKSQSGVAVQNSLLSSIQSKNKSKIKKFTLCIILFDAFLIIYGFVFLILGIKENFTLF